MHLHCQSLCLAPRERPTTTCPIVVVTVVQHSAIPFRTFDNARCFQVLQALDHVTRRHGSQPRHIRTTRKETPNFTRQPATMLFGSATMTHECGFFSVTIDNKRLKVNPVSSRVYVQHSALEAASTQFWPRERIFAYLDDINMVPMTERFGAVCASLKNSCAFKPKSGSTVARVTCGIVERPQICGVLGRIARLHNHRAVVWRRSGIPSDQLGMKVLGTPGHADFVTQHLQSVTLLHCASARANCQVRSVCPRREHLAVFGAHLADRPCPVQQ